MKTLRSAFAAVAAACTLSASAAGVDRFVDYLESTGNSSSKGQLILLDYTPCGTTRVVTTVAALDTTRTHGIFCARGNNTNVIIFSVLGALIAAALIYLFIKRGRVVEAISVVEEPGEIAPDDKGEDMTDTTPPSDDETKNE